MKKESAVFVRVPIMAFGILLLTCNCALAQKELVIEYTAESERMRCTIEEYVQNGDEIKYSVQDEPADIQIMTYKQMQKAAENGDILPIEVDDVFRLSQPEMRCYVISSHTQVYEQAQRFLKIYAKNAELSEIRFDEDL